MDWKRIGPLTIRERLSPLTYRLKLPEGYRIHDVFHISLLSPVKTDQIKGQTQPPPPPVLIKDPETEEPEEHYQIKRYLDSRWIKTKNNKWDFQYLVKWEGYDDHTWESREKLEHDTRESKQELGPDDDDFDLEEEFYSKHPEAPHHNDPEKERFITQTSRTRRKGKAPIRRTK